MKNISNYSYPKKQQGAVLLVAIVLLLVITILGVGAVNTAGIKTQVAGNSIFTMSVFQGAESALEKSASRNDFGLVNSAFLVKPAVLNVPAAVLPAEIIAGSAVNSKATIVYIPGKADCSASVGLGTSSSIKCRVFRVNAISTLNNTNASDSHTKGVESHTN